MRGICLLLFFCVVASPVPCRWCLQCLCELLSANEKFAPLLLACPPPVSHCLIFLKKSKIKKNAICYWLDFCSLLFILFLGIACIQRRPCPAKIATIRQTEIIDAGKGREATILSFTLFKMLPLCADLRE
nr:hypothetical protein [Pandoravirus massiliensis]